MRTRMKSTKMVLRTGHNARTEERNIRTEEHENTRMKEQTQIRTQVTEHNRT